MSLCTNRYIHNIPYLVLLRVNLKRHWEMCTLLLIGSLLEKNDLHCSVQLIPLQRWSGCDGPGSQFWGAGWGIPGRSASCLFLQLLGGSGSYSILHDKSVSAHIADFVFYTLTKTGQKLFFFFFLNQMVLVKIMELWRVTAWVWLPALPPACSLTLRQIV